MVTNKQLYNQIETIYENLEFSSKLIIDDFLIIKSGKSFQCYYKISEFLKLQFRVCENYSLVYKTFHSLNYEIISYVDSDSVFREISHDQEIPESFISLIAPVIRQFNLQIISE